MIHNEHGLMIFIDAQPTEQLQADDNTVICIAASMCLEKDGFPGLKQYKDTPAADRPDVAQSLADFLQADDCPVRSAAIIARSMDYARYGDQLVATLPEKVPRQVSPERYRVDDGRLNASLVLALPMYASAICMLGLRAAIWVQKLNQKKVTLVLDLLPSDPARALEFVRRLSHHPDLFPLWKDTMETFGVDIKITNIQSYVDDDGNTMDGKEHPCAIMADWIAHSIYAGTTTGAKLDQGAERTEEYRRAITRPFFALHDRERIRLVSTTRLVTPQAQAKAMAEMTDNRAIQLLETVNFTDRMCRLLFASRTGQRPVPRLDEQTRFVEEGLAPVVQAFLVGGCELSPNLAVASHPQMRPEFVTDEFNAFCLELAGNYLEQTGGLQTKKEARRLSRQFAHLVRSVLQRYQPGW